MAMETVFTFCIISLLPCCLGNVNVNSANDEKENCICLPYYQCSFESGNLITDGKGLLDLRILDNTGCQGYFDVCCNISKTTAFSVTETPEENYGCGYQNSGFFPWYAALFHQEEKSFPASYKCGVSLIHSRAILTAAHCIRESGIWTVHVGNNMRRVSKVIIHPEYVHESLQNDIALAILKEPIQISKKVNTICITPPGTNLDYTNCRTTSRVVGANHEGSFLKMLHVTVVPKDKCVSMLRSTRLGPFFKLHNSFLCAGTENHKNTCTGDGGSPLVCPVAAQPGRYHQAGIVSWGIGCGESNVPDVYIKVSSFRGWIDSEMINNGLDITSYRY